MKIRSVHIFAALAILVFNSSWGHCRSGAADSIKITFTENEDKSIQDRLNQYSYQIESEIKENFKSISFSIEKMTIDEIHTKSRIDTAVKVSPDILIEFKDPKSVDDVINMTPYLYFIRQDGMLLLEELQAENLISYTGEFSSVRFKRHPLSETEPLATFLAAYANIRTGRYNQAIQLLKTIIHHDNYAVYFFLGNAYLKQGEKYLPNVQLAYAQWDSAALNYHLGLADSSSMSDRDELAWLFNNLAVTHQEMDKLEEALTFYHRALEKSSKNLLTIRIFRNISNIYLLQGEWEKATLALNNCIEIMTPVIEDVYLSFLYDNVGHIHRLTMQPVKAFELYEKSRDIRKEGSDDGLLAQSYGYLGDASFDQKNYTAALEYYQSELDINLSLKHEPRIARSYGKLGDTLLKMQQTDGAILYFEKSLELFELTGEDHGTITASNQLAGAYYAKEYLQKSLDYYGKSLQLAIARNAEPQLAYIYDNIANIYNKRNESLKALQYYSHASELYQTLNHFESLSLVLFNMGLINLKNKEYKSAYGNIKRALEIDEQYMFNNLKREKIFLEKLEKLATEDSE